MKVNNTKTRRSRFSYIDLKFNVGVYTNLQLILEFSIVRLK